MLVRIFSCGIILWGAWIAWTQRARFDIGGSETGTSRPIRVSAEGVDAILIGVFIIGVGILGVAQTLRTPFRIPAILTGAIALIVPVVYATWQVGRAIYTMFVQE
jgi:hypothetical protein